MTDEGFNDPLAEELKLTLEWAGSKLLALPIASPAPRAFKSAWPDYATDASSAYGYTRETLRAPAPTAKEIALMDEILCLPSEISEQELRRVLHLRALVTPVSQRYLWPWTRLAAELHTDRRRAARLHYKALCAVLSAVKASKMRLIRQNLLLLQL